MRIFSEEARKNPLQLVLEIVLLMLFLGIVGGFFLIFIGSGSYEKGAAKRTACLSNVKQITTATILYADDNNDSLPPHFTFDGKAEARNFITSLESSVHKSDLRGWETTFVCPFDRPNFTNGNPVTGEQGIPGKMSYVHCNSLKKIIPDFVSGKRILRVSTVANPETTAFIRDPIRSTENGVPHSPHDSSSDFTFGFLDGHAKRKKENYAADL